MAIQSTNDKMSGYYDSLLTLDKKLAKKYSKMNNAAKEIADAGISRHFRACHRNDINPDTEAINEVLKSALNGRRSYC